MKNIPTDIFNLKTVKRQVEAGSIMVAEPFLGEKYFRHGVIAIIDHNGESGSMGVVMNNPSGYSLNELLDGVKPAHGIPVYCGGPVSLDRLYFIHSLGNEIIPGATEFAPNLWIGGDFEVVIDYVNSGYLTDGILRFFLGYSGWTAGQLEEEIDKSVWAVTSSDTVSPYELLNLHGDALWHRTVSRMGSPYRQWLLHPRDPRAN